MCCAEFFQSLVGAQLLRARSPQQDGASLSEKGVCSEVWVTFMDRPPYCELPLDMWAAEAVCSSELAVVHAHSSCILITTALLEMLGTGEAT